MTNTAEEDDKSHGFILEMVLGNYPSRFGSKKEMYLLSNPERD